MYEVANGARIPNLGEKTFRASSEEGHVRDLRAQVADTRQPLLSVSKLVAAGNTVVFGPEGSYIQDGSGETIWMEAGGGMYTVKLWVKSGKQNCQAPDAGF